jgi:hypothetical protein
MLAGITPAVLEKLREAAFRLPASGAAIPAGYVGTLSRCRLTTFNGTSSAK